MGLHDQKLLRLSRWQQQNLKPNRALLSIGPFISFVLPLLPGHSSYQCVQYFMPLSFLECTGLMAMKAALLPSSEKQNTLNLKFYTQPIWQLSRWANRDVFRLIRIQKMHLTPTLRKKKYLSSFSKKAELPEKGTRTRNKVA